MTMQLSSEDLALLKSHPGGIYCIALKDEVWQAQPDGYPKTYIGQACENKTIKRRISEHLGMLLSGKHHSKKLQGAWNKYGEESFECFAIELCDDADLNHKEEHWIWRFNAHGKHGYNVAIYAGSSTRGRVVSAGTRAKIGAAHKGKNVSAKTREKLRAANKGNPRAKPHSAATRAQMSASAKGKIKSAAHCAAIKAAQARPETKERHSAALKGIHLGKKQSPETVAKRLATQRANREYKLLQKIFSANNLACSEW